jgi:hypothetical protein
MRDIWVDFNGLDGDTNWLFTHARFAEQHADLSLGARVIAGDNDGNVCEADVLEVDAKGVVRLCLDVGTFNNVNSASGALVDR